MSNTGNIADRIYAVTHAHVQHRAKVQSGLLVGEGAERAMETGKEKLLALLEPLDEASRLAVCEQTMRYVDQNTPHLAAVGMFNREFIGLLTAADPALAMRLVAKIRAASSAEAIPERPFKVGEVAEGIRTALVIPYLTQWLMGANRDNVARQEEVSSLFIQTMLQIRQVLGRYTPDQQKATKDALIRRMGRDVRTAAYIQVVQALLSDVDPDDVYMTIG